MGVPFFDMAIMSLLEETVKLRKTIRAYAEAIELIHEQLLHYYDDNEDASILLENISDIIQDELVEKGYWSG